MQQNLGELNAAWHDSQLRVVLVKMEVAQTKCAVRRSRTELARKLKTMADKVAVHTIHTKHDLSPALE